MCKHEDNAPEFQGAIEGVLTEINSSPASRLGCLVMSVLVLFYTEGPA